MSVADPGEAMSGNVDPLAPGHHLRILGRLASPESVELRDFLTRNCVDYLWLDVDKDPLVQYLGAASLDSVRLPVCVFPDGDVLEAPTRLEVARRVGLHTSPEHDVYDLTIVGGGPAGLTAAVYGASEGLRTLLIERDAPGGQAGTSSRIENYLGFPEGLSGSELTGRALRQARRLGAEIIVANSVAKADHSAGSPVPLELDDGTTLETRAGIMATGVTYRTLDAPGAKELTGKGVYYGAAPGEERFYEGCDVCAIGGGNSAGQAALNLARLARSVTVVVRADSLAKGMSHYLVERLESTPNVLIHLSSEVTLAEGEDRLESIRIRGRESEAEQTVAVDALFVLIGGEPQGDYAPSIRRDERGFMLTGPDLMNEPGFAERWPLERAPHFLETSWAGLLAAGDIRSGAVKRVASAVGEGAMAVQLAHQVLQRSS
ncbi:MAG: NAD(P)/FAD-dependent oxidoreductase [Gaiellaceae bacterium]